MEPGILLPPELASIPRKGDPGYEEWLEREKLRPPWNFGEGTPGFRSGAAYWLETAQKHALTPKTVVVPVKHDLGPLFDREEPHGFGELLASLEAACAKVGYPAFLRTDYTSGKHFWEDCCGGVRGPEDIRKAVCELNEFSGMIDQPVTLFLVREMLATRQVFPAFRGMPVTREFRIFAERGKITHIQPYWPEESFNEGDYVRELDAFPDWREKLRLMSVISSSEYEDIARISRDISLDLPEDGWSIDWLQDAFGKWWLTDMASVCLSYRWEPSFKVVDDAAAKKAADAGVILSSASIQGAEPQKSAQPKARTPARRM